MSAASASYTVTEKAALTSGNDIWHSTELTSEIRSLLLTDGPHGVRMQQTGGDALGLGDSAPATCFPPAVALGSTWDVDLARRVGAALGREARALGVDVLLGPGMNIKRSPLCGRNFEYFSEDPHLTARIAAASVEGMQSAGVGACVKHFAVNNQETDRMRVSAEIDQRALREIYLSAFEFVVRNAAPTMVMSAYNRINGIPASENHWLLTELLRSEWGFEGVVVSDWGAVDDRVATLRAGLDLEMPPSGTDDRITTAVTAGELAESALDQVLTRLRRLQQRLDKSRGGSETAEPTTIRTENARLARDAAAEAAVLLTSDGILPLDATVEGSVAVVGELARTPRFQGGGSSKVAPTESRGTLEVLQERLATVRFAPGYTTSPDAKPVDSLAADAVAAARAARTTLLFLGLPEHAESEGYDRTTLALPAEQVELLRRIRAVTDRIVVVLSNGGVVSVAEWQDDANAVLEGWLLGQGGADATADLLLGERSPAGRLAETIPLRLADHPTFPNYPGADGISVYGESTYVGYRYFDTAEMPVAHPFGHGLSYTRFDYSDPDVIPGDADTWRVSVTVTNTGQRAGKEVVQLYVGPDDGNTAARPRSELRGFTKVDLAPGESQRVTLPLSTGDLAVWDARGERWRVRAGDYTVRVGSSSRDIRVSETVRTSGDGLVEPLSGQDTIAEWLNHPEGARVLGEAVEQLGVDGSALGSSPELAAIFGSVPLNKLRSFGLGITDDTIAALIARANPGS